MKSDTDKLQSLFAKGKTMQFDLKYKLNPLLRSASRKRLSLFIAE